jgi:AP-3 complex subunit beta
MSSRAIGGDAHFFDDSTTPSKVRQYLDSTKEHDKLKGMKWLLAMLSKGRDVSEFFADVVKNVVVKSIEVKKMVYIYLVHYADYDHTCREIALLSINSFQRDMSGENQLIRGLALRVMTSIRVPDIIQIQLLAARKCASDTSPYVRKCAAVALTKIHVLDPEQVNNLKSILEKLLKDNSTMVLGSAVAAFNEICPNSYEILHRSYRKLCHLLADMDEWTQITALEVMTRYCRNQFIDPAPGVAAAIKLRAKQRSASAVKGHISSTVKRKIMKKAFYSDEEDEEEEVEVAVKLDSDRGSVFVNTGGIVENEADVDLDPDHRLILRSSLPLLKSRNSGVVLAVCALHYYCGPQNDGTTQQIGKALVRILRNRREIQYVVLKCINTMAQERPAFFRPFLSDFFIKSTDPVFNKLLKLEILTSICTKENIDSILRELQLYVKHRDTSFVCASIRAIGRAADADPAVAPKCIEGVFMLLCCHKSEEVIGESVNVLRLLLQQNAGAEASRVVLFKLAKLLVSSIPGKKIVVPVARASIVWLVGEFYDVLQSVSPDILRILSISFADENNETKTQIVNFAIKLALRLPDDENVQSLMTYILEMSRYDIDTDIRDRSRFMTALMGLAPSAEEGSTASVVLDEDALEELAEHSRGIMLAPKLPPITLLGSVDIEGLPNFNLGSLSSLVGHYVSGYEPLSSWPAHQPDANVRDANRYADEGQSSPTPGNNTYTSGSRDSSGDEADQVKVKGFYGEDSDTESNSSEEGSESGSDESSEEGSDDNEDSSEEESSEEDDDEQEEESESSSSEEEVQRMPITNNKGAAPRVVRRVTPKKKDDAVSTANRHNSSLKTPVGTGTFDSPNLMSDMFGGMNMSSGNGSGNDLESFFSTSTPVPATNKASDNLVNHTPSNNVTDVMSAFDALTPPAPHSAFVSPNPNAFTGMMNMTAMQTLSNSAMGNSAMLGGQKLSALTADLTNEVMSEPKVILKPEIGGGLAVSIAYRFNSSSVAFAGGSCVCLILRNNKDINLRRIKLTFPTDLKRTNMEDVALLTPGQELKVPLEMQLAPYVGKHIKIDVRSDQGSYVGNFTPEPYELIVPLHLSVAEFTAHRSRLGGFNEGSKTYSLESLGFAGSPVDNIETMLITKIRNVLNTNVVQGKGMNELMFAGSIPKGAIGEKVLISITINENELQIKCNCDDAMLPTQLINLFKLITK